MDNILEIENLIEKLQKKKAFIRDDEVNLIDDYIKQLNNAILILKLKEHPIIQEIIEKYKKEIENINNILLNAYSDEISDKKRDRLLAYKKCCQIFIDTFNVDDIINTIKMVVE